MKNRSLSRILAIALAFTMAVSQGSFAFADEDRDGLLLQESARISREQPDEETPNSEVQPEVTKEEVPETGPEETVTEPGPDDPDEDTLDFPDREEDMENAEQTELTENAEEEGPAGAPEEEETADYSAVDEALAKVPEDLSIYTEESARAVTDAVNAVIRDLPASQQEEVDAMAQAIEEAVAALVLKDTEPVELAVTNTTSMFKVVSASLLVEEGQEYLVIALSATGYHELFKGTYEEAVLNGDGTSDKGNDAWVHGQINSEGKWEFKLPLDGSESYIPVVAISNSYYVQYLGGTALLERGFFPRQLELDREAGTLVTGDYNETTDFEVTSNVADFKVESRASTNVVGGPNSNNYSLAPVLVMQDGTYDEVIYPTVIDGEVSTAKAEIKDGKFEISMTNAPGIEAFKDKEPIEMTFHVAEDAPYNAAGKYVVRKVTIDKMAKTIVIDGSPLQEHGSDTPDDTVEPGTSGTGQGGSGNSGSSGSGSGNSGSTPAVDSGTTLPDGEYVPDSFSFSGGTGKLTITCTKIIIKNGQAYAVIVFSSTNVDQLKAAGNLYYKQGSGYSTFTIPVDLNANNVIIARTTAMSQPHWVQYVLYIGLAENSEQSEKAREAKKDAAEARMKISDEAPAIMGLEASDAESTVEYAEYFRIFEYENGVRLLSIDISTDTELKEEYTENAEKAIFAGESDEQVEYDEEGNIVTKSNNEYTEALYKNNVVNYLLVPEDYDVPAGLDKEYIIVTVPSERTFMASREAIDLMEQLGCLDAISLLGIDKEEIESEDLKKALEDEKVQLAGNAEKFDFAKVVRDDSDLAVLPGDLLPEEIAEEDKDNEDLTEEAACKKETLEKLESRFTALEVPVLIDRSAQEKDALARAEWIKVYGALFGCDDLAEKIFNELAKEADNDDKN